LSPKGLAYVGRRLALAIPTLLTIVLLNFALLHLLRVMRQTCSR
jgi:ABC-type microcin C transport system permease subunit YejB